MPEIDHEANAEKIRQLRLRCVIDPVKYPPAMPRRREPDPAYLAERLTACRACEETDCQMKHCKPCRLKAELKVPGMACPLTPPKWKPVLA